MKLTFEEVAAVTTRRLAHYIVVRDKLRIQLKGPLAAAVIEALDPVHQQAAEEILR